MKKGICNCGQRSIAFPAFSRHNGNSSVHQETTYTQSTHIDTHTFMRHATQKKITHQHKDANASIMHEWAHKSRVKYIRLRIETNISIAARVRERVNANATSLHCVRRPKKKETHRFDRKKIDKRKHKNIDFRLLKSEDECCSTAKRQSIVDSQRRREEAFVERKE